MAEGAHFESEYFLTLTYLPPVEAEERAKGWLFEGGSARAATQTAEQILERFRNRVDNFENIFGSLKEAPKTVTSPHAPVPFSAALEDLYIPSQAKIEAAVRAVMDAGKKKAAE